MDKLTLENKAKFFAQYWGQRVLSWRLDNENLAKNLERVSSHTLTTGLRGWVAHLKPLSAISCDEATEIAVFVGMVNAKAFRFKDDFVVVKDDSYSLVFDKGIITMYYNGKVWHDDTLRIADKSRSMGFLYEFMDLSREEILNRGWAVVEQPNDK